VDSLPAGTTRAFELVGAARTAWAGARPRLVALVNGGFPEASQGNVALAICREFARAAGFDWAGGIALGAGGLLGGQPLVELGDRAAHARNALAACAGAIVDGLPVPQDAQDLAERLPISAWLYRQLGNLGTCRTAVRHGVFGHLEQRPYE
jgi:hypothetical protein